MRKNIKKIILTSLSLSFILANISSFASPSFTRSSEEWARLKDNKLEYDEIEGLIEEYNPSVKENESNYIKFRKDYGDSNTKLRDNYRRLANEILSSIADAEPESPNYIATLTANANARAQAESLLNNADNSLEDAGIMKLNNDMAIKTLVWNAKNNMISYYTNIEEIEKEELQKELSEQNLSNIELNFKLGTSIKSEVLNVKDSLLKSEQSLQNAKAEKEKVAKKLQIMTGWSYEANPEFVALPELDLEKINTYNPATDLSKAIENNYSLKINEKKLANVSSNDAKTKLETIIASNKSNIAISLNNAYSNINLAKASYDAANSNLSLQKNNLLAAKLKAKVGSISSRELETSKINEKLANVNLKLAKYNLFSAMEAYEFNIKGLANTEIGAK